MNRHGLKGTFNLNSGLYAPEGTVYPADRIHRRMTMSKSTEVYLNSGHEVAVHTLTHPYLDRLPSDRVVYEVMKDRENLEKQFGVIVKGMAYPYGNTSDQAVEAIKSCGIVYARTTVSTNTFDIPTDWLRMPTTCYHRSPALRKLTTTFLKECADNRLFILPLGHSYDFDTNDSWHDIEVFAEQVGNRDDIWYATNMEIYEYVQDYNRLNFSVDGTLVQNPNRKNDLAVC